MKVIFSILILILSNNVFSQSFGGLMVRTYTNSTNNLSDNKHSDSTRVRIVNIGLAIDTTVYFSTTNNFRIHLKAGKYNLTCISGENSIDLQEVIISSDRITFVNLLFEPKNKLSFFDRRERKKKFYYFGELKRFDLK